MHIRGYFITLLLALFPAACTSSSVQSTASPSLGPQSISNHALNNILRDMENRGKSLRDLTADVKFTTNDQDMGNIMTLEGRLWFQNRDDAKNQDVSIHLIYEKCTADNHTQSINVEYLLSDGWLWERGSTTKTQNRYQVARPGEMVDLLELDKGPYPIPIGQQPARMYQEFDIQIFGQAIDDPPNTVHLHMKPKQGTHLAHRFATIELWVDSTSHLPIRMQTQKADSPEVITMELSDVKIDQGIPSDQFRLPEVKGWTEHDEPYEP